MNVTIAPLDAFARLPDVYEIYALALDGDVAPIDAFGETQLARHAARDDFVFLGASEDDALVGIAYGYRGRYGQWWTDNVGAAMDDATRREWLDAPHFEVTELHVHPDRQRRGTGKALLDELLRRQPYDRAPHDEPGEPEGVGLLRPGGLDEARGGPLDRGRARPVRDGEAPSAIDLNRRSRRPRAEARPQPTPVSRSRG